MERWGPRSDPNLVGTLLEGRYRVGAVLAHGGMSTVYQGIDTRLDRPVAIKVMDPRLAVDPAFLQRFAREARAAARLHHPGIIGVYDQGVDSSAAGDQVFLVMELVNGGTLRNLLHEHGPLPLPLAFTVAGQVLSALAAAHQEGFVHRDVKPENVLIGTDGVLKVADFGLVRAVAEASNSGELILGTVAYLSPEQVATGSADPRSDVYATGVLLFELLTGTPPYTGDTALSVAYRHVNDDVPAPSRAGVAVPAAVDDLIVQATRRDPAARPADAAAFLLALQQVAADLEIDPVPIPVPVPSAVAPATSAGSRRRPAGANTRLSTSAGARTAVVTPPGEFGPRGTRALLRPAAPGAASGTAPGTRTVPQPSGLDPGGFSAGAGSAPPGRSADDPYQRERSRNRRVFIIWTVLVLLLASVIGVASWWLGSGRWTTVPDLTGLRSTAVEAELADAGLDANLIEDHHDTVPTGAVINSDPGPGSRALRGTDVTVRLSLGRPVVPDLPVGISVTEAERRISEDDLSPQRDPAATEFHDTVEEGAVIGLQPAPGTVLSVGAPVTLVISKGPAPTTVPDVRGRPASEAIAVLTEAGLAPQVQNTFDNDLPGGHAIGTDPESGTQTFRGTTVTLLVSTALVVPDVVGQPRGQALQALTAAGFDPEERGDGAGQDAARVLAVGPEAGSLVDPSDNRVTVQLSTRIPVPDVVGMPVDQARKVLADAGLNSEVRQFFGDSSSQVLRQSPGPGRAVQPGSTIMLLTF